MLGATSDNEGYYTLTQIPPGQYELIVSMIGYEVEREAMIIVENENLTVNF